MPPRQYPRAVRPLRTMAARRRREPRPCDPWRTPARSVADRDPAGRPVYPDQPAVRQHDLRIGMSEVNVEDTHGHGSVLSQRPEHGLALAVLVGVPLMR